MTDQAQIWWTGKGYPHLNPQKKKKFIMIALMIKTQARNNERKRLIVKGNDSTKGCNRVELDRIKR